MSRIDNIKNYADKVEKDRINKIEEELMAINILENKVRELKSRILELIEVANVARDNNIPIEWHEIYQGSSYADKDFSASKISHHVGFWTQKNVPIKYVGIGAGGACGSWDFYTDGEEIFEKHENYGTLRKPTLKWITKFIENFDTFEQAFYEYIDDVTKNRDNKI